MSLNIPAIARAALEKAWTAAATALKSATIKFAPVATYNPATDATTVVWGASVTCDVLLYDEEQGEEDAGNLSSEGLSAQVKLAKALVRRVDIEPNDPTESTEVTVDGVVWKVNKVLTPPGDAMNILELRR